MVVSVHRPWNERDELAILDRKLVIGKAEIAFELFDEVGFEDALVTVEGVAGEPDQFGFVEAALAGLLELFAKLLDVDVVCEAKIGGAVDQEKDALVRGETFPDELQHQELVEIGVEQRARDGIDFPVVVVRATGKIDDHGGIRLPQLGRLATEALRTGVWELGQDGVAWRGVQLTEERPQAGGPFG